MKMPIEKWMRIYGIEIDANYIDGERIKYKEEVWSDSVCYEDDGSNYVGEAHVWEIDTDDGKTWYIGTGTAEGEPWWYSDYAYTSKAEAIDEAENWIDNMEDSIWTDIYNDYKPATLKRRVEIDVGHYTLVIDPGEEMVYWVHPSIEYRARLYGVYARKEYYGIELLVAYESEDCAVGKVEVRVWRDSDDYRDLEDALEV